MYCPEELYQLLQVASKSPLNKKIQIKTVFCRAKQG